MAIPISHNDFINMYYDEAWRVADIVIASTVQKNGPIHPSIDIESVKAEGVMAALERTFENYDPEHASGAKVKTLLGIIVRNCVLSELGKATTDAIRAGLIARPKKSNKNERHYKSLISGISQRQTSSGPFEVHEYMDYTGWQERKEDVLRKLSKYMKNERDEIEIPSFIEIIREVTDDGRYTNAALAERIPPEETEKPDSTE